MTTQSIITLHFEGESIKDGRLLWDDLSLFISHFDAAIDRIIKLKETGVSIKQGRPTKATQSLSALEIVALNTGSFEIALSFRREQDLLPGLDAGEEAFTALTNGLTEFTNNGNNALLPEYFDRNVLASLREAGRIFSRGIDTVDITKVNGHAPTKLISYTKPLRERIISKMRTLEQAWITVEGRLLMADVKEGALRCRLHPSTGETILCSFDEDITANVISNLRQFVQVRGEAQIDTAANKIQTITIRDLEPIDEPTQSSTPTQSPSAFWQTKTFEELASEQGVYPVADWSKFVGGWPEDTDYESFLHTIRSARDIDIAG